MAKVLIAEDHALVRQGMRVLLETEGYDVAEVEDGAEAFKHIRNGGVDLALLDIGLPVRSGVDVLQEVRRRELPTRVIVMTGDTDHYSPADLYAMGADAFVYKTADADHLMDTIAAVFAGRVLPQQNSDSPSAAAVLREQLTDRVVSVASAPVG